MVVIGISNEPIETIRNFARDQGLTYPILRDDHSVYIDYFIPGGISPYPRDFIIDQDGIIQYTNTEYDIHTMQSVLESLIPSLDLSDPVSGPDTSPSDTTADSTSVSEVTLHQNYPNPITDHTTISYELPEANFISISIYNLAGQQIVQIYSGVQSAGKHELTWPGVDRYGIPLPNGVYFYELAGSDYALREKMIIIR